MRLLRDSESLRAIPTGWTTRKIVTSPAAFANWAALFADTPPAPGVRYTLRRGNYSPWGQGLIVNGVGVGGTADQPVIIEYEDTDSELHPVRRKGTANEAIIDGLKFNGSTHGHWLMTGLTNRNPTVDTDIIAGPGGICFDRCLFEEPAAARHYGIRLRSGDDNVVQRCVVRGYINAAGDLGINIVPDNGAMARARILDNEVYDCGDSFQVSQNAVDGTIATDGLVEGNDFYFTSAYQNPDGTGDMENAMDFKAGNDATPWIVRNNRCWGTRTNLVSATGDLLVVHVNARNIRFIENILGDAQAAYIETVTGSYARNIVFWRNLVHDIQRYYPEEHGGAAFRAVSNTRLEGNVVARSNSVLYVPGALENGGPVCRGNVRIDTAINHAGTANTGVYLDGPNDERTVARFAGYQRKRWTGIEVAEGALPLQHARAARDGWRRGNAAWYYNTPG